MKKTISVQSDWDRLQLIQRVRKNSTHGLPTSVEDVRRLYELATGETIKVRRRCEFCDGEGFVLVADEKTPADRSPAARCKHKNDPGTCVVCRLEGNIQFTEHGGDK